MSKPKYTERNCFSLHEFCFRNGIGRTTAYKEIKEGRLHPKKVGKRTLISVEEEARWFDSAPNDVSLVDVPGHVENPVHYSFQFDRR